MFAFMSRATELKQLEDHLYEAKRMLIDAEYKSDHAEAVLRQHQANVMMFKHRIGRLVGRLASVKPGTSDNDLSGSQS